MNRWAIFLSGRGSTAQAVFDLMGMVNIGLVVSSRKSALGLLRARRMGLATMTLAKEVDWQDLNQQLRLRKINRIFLLGFMRLIPADFCQKWQGQIINLHPSLLPLYAGKDAMEKSFQEKAAMGISVHHVTEEMDAGELILQKEVFPQSGGLDWSSVQLKMSLMEQRLVREAVL